MWRPRHITRDWHSCASKWRKYPPPAHPLMREGGGPVDVLHLEPLESKKISEVSRMIIENNETYKKLYNEWRVVPANPEEWYPHVSESVKQIQDCVSRPVDMEKVSLAVNDILSAIKEEIKEPTELTAPFDRQEAVSLTELLERMNTTKFGEQLNTILDEIFKTHIGDTISSDLLKVHAIMCQEIKEIRDGEGKRIGLPEERQMDPLVEKPMSELRLLALSISMLTAVSDFLTALIYINWPLHPRMFKKTIQLFDIARNKNKACLDEFIKKWCYQIKAYFLQSGKLPQNGSGLYQFLAAPSAHLHNVTQWGIDSSDDEEGAPQRHPHGGEHEPRDITPFAEQSTGPSGEGAANGSNGAAP